MPIKTHRYNAHILEDSLGLKLKRSPMIFENISELVEFYSNPKQTELPQHLLL